MRTIVLATLLLATSPAASGQQLDPSETVLRLPTYKEDGTARTWFLADSEWGYISKFNRALAERLDRCADAPPEAAASLRSGASRFSQATLPALSAARACGVPVDAEKGAISLQAWQMVTGSAAAPSVFDRAKTIVFRRSRLTPDYSHTLWDYDRTVYRESVFTWGPLHATLGEGCTLRGFLVYLNQRSDLQDAIEFSFGPEMETLARLRSAPCSFSAVSAAVEPAYSDPDRKKSFADGFAILASDSRVRAAYDEQLLGPSSPRRVQFSNYYELYRQAQRSPTEVDFAFILEHALLTPVGASTERMRQLGQAASSQSFGTNAEFRRWVNSQYIERSGPGGRWMADPTARSFMNGRMTAYFVDGVGETALTEQESRDWLAHSRTRASDVGLSDRRQFQPCEMGGSAPNCTLLFQR